MGTSAFSRRALLTAASAASGSWVLSACGSQAPQASGNTSATAPTTPSATGTASAARASSSPTAAPKVTQSPAPSTPTMKPSASPTANEKPLETKPSEKANPEATASESSQPKDQKSQPEGGTTEEPSAPESKKPAEHTSVESHPESLRCIVNKTRPFSPQDWAPQDLVPFYGQQLRAEAAAAAQSMMDAAARDGVTLTVSSAYRSFAAQKQTYQHWVQVNGQKTADTLSARPGYSEHQTGLAIDFGSPEGCLLQECYQDTRAGQWLAKNAPDFGFILRFPKNQQHVTGYIFEPWHYRYLGVGLTQEYRASGAKTLEEFFGTGAAPDYLG